MFKFNHVVFKLGNMRKAQDFTLYPRKTGEDAQIIQSDGRIASINLQTGKGVLSSGKGGHQGFLALNKILGAMDVQLTPEQLVELQQKAGVNAPGEAVVIGGSSLV